MVAKFLTSSFEFTDKDPVLEHDEVYPREGERDPNKFWLEGEDTFSWEYYPLAIDIDDLPTAEMLRAARLRNLERSQPTSTSGGQDFGGIQDKVYIRHPDNTVE